jgi:hypothetical protein
MRITTVAIRIVQCQVHVWSLQLLRKQVTQLAYPSAEGNFTVSMLYIRKKQDLKKIH